MEGEGEGVSTDGKKRGRSTGGTSLGVGEREIRTSDAYREGMGRARVCWWLREGKGREGRRG